MSNDQNQLNFNVKTKIIFDHKAVPNLNQSNEIPNGTIHILQDLKEAVAAAA